MPKLYTISRIKLVTGEYGYVLRSPDGKWINEAFTKSPIAPVELRNQQAKLNTNLFFEESFEGLI